ncbi:MAG: TIGR01457 family HAD-type hydrolase [Phototrophicales bacterium]|nr:MAG: TIGR01457 family HAD-type hydrolase [Phototrophicales bacterium]
MMIRGILLDMDGVLYHGTRRLEGVLVFFDWMPIPYCFVTNNSSRTPQQVAEKLASMEIAASPNQIITSSIVTAHYLRENAPPKARILAIGEVGLFTALEEAGFILVDNHPDYVVVGLDRAFDDPKLHCAVQAIHSGAKFIATNMDMVLMTQNGALPGTGTIVNRIAETAQQEPLIMGKPQRPIFEMAANQLHLPMQELLMIGDNLETDVRGALQNGLLSAWLSTGVSTYDDLQNTALTPHFIGNNLVDLIPQIEAYIV